MLSSAAVLAVEFLQVGLVFFHFLVSIALIVLVLLHSGREAGLGGMGFVPTSQGGTHIVERNLTRVTIVVATVFAINTILLFRLLEWEAGRRRAVAWRLRRSGASRLHWPARAGGGIGRRARLRALWALRPVEVQVLSSA